MIEILVLSLIQGITEFIPISSSSHLIIMSDYLEFNEADLTIDVSLHIGSFVAVVTYFRKDLIDYIKNRKLFFKIIISSIPIMIVGYLLVKLEIIYQLRNLEVIGWTTIIFGIFLFISDRFDIEKSIEKDFSLKSAIIIGLFQVLSLVPGVSRSGITISSSRLLNFSRYDSAKISFLLSIPTLAAVSFFGLKEIVDVGKLDFSFFNILSIFLSFIFSYITIKYFFKYIKKFSLNLFVIYRLVLGVIILIVAYL